MTHPESNPQTISLESLEIASPCSASWNDMVGTNEVRFCNQCELNVYNLSGMTREDAESLVTSTEGKLCIRMYRREDGTVLTQDCPVGLEIRYQKTIQLQPGQLQPTLTRRWSRLSRQAAAVAITVVAALGTFTAITLAETKGDMTMGEMTAPQVNKQPAPQPTAHPTPLMGSPTPQERTPPANPNIELGKPHIKQGKPQAKLQGQMTVPPSKQGQIMGRIPVKKQPCDIQKPPGKVNSVQGKPALKPAQEDKGTSKED